jgi:hypothetical protein
MQQQQRRKNSGSIDDSHVAKKRKRQSIPGTTTTTTTTHMTINTKDSRDQNQNTTNKIVRGRGRSNSFVAEDEDEDDIAKISIFSVVKVKKRKWKGIKQHADYGIVINIHTRDKNNLKNRTSYDIEFASDDHVEIRVPKKKVKLASFEKKKRKQRNKKRKSHVQNSPLRNIKKTIGSSSKKSTSKHKNDTKKKKVHSNKSSKDKGKKKKSTTKKKKKKRDQIDPGPASIRRPPKGQERKFYMSQLVTVLWREDWFEADIVQDHGDGTYAVL